MTIQTHGGKGIQIQYQGLILSIQDNIKKEKKSLKNKLCFFQASTT